MTYLEVLQDIGGMVNDPDLQTYKDRAKLHFIRAINDLIKGGEFDESDYMAYIEAFDTLSFASVPVSLVSKKVLLIKEIYPPPGTPKKIQCIRKSPADVAKLARNQELTPSPEELFYWVIGENLYAQVGSPSNANLSADTFTLEYVTDVDDSAWLDATDLQSSGKYLSLRLVRAAIGVAVKTLEAEIAGE